MLVAVMPESSRPSILPLSAWSWIEIQDAFWAGFGTQSNANSFADVAASPYHALSRLTMKAR